MPLPSITFNGSVGVASTGNAGPEALKTDIGNLMAMFDPAKLLSDSSAGGISAENINADAIETAAIKDGQVTAAKTAGVSAATASTIVVRDASGRAAFADPAASGDAATKNYVDTKALLLAGGTMTGKVYAQANTDYTTGQVRNVFLSTGDPSGGGNGDIWLKHPA